MSSSPIQSSSLVQRARSAPRISYDTVEGSNRALVLSLDHRVISHAGDSIIFVRGSSDDGGAASARQKLPTDVY